MSLKFHNVEDDIKYKLMCQNIKNACDLLDDLRLSILDTYSQDGCPLVYARFLEVAEDFQEDSSRLLGISSGN